MITKEANSPNLHKWENNVCKKCGIKREDRTSKLLMAITNHPPYNHYQYRTLKYYFSSDKVFGFERPGCVITQGKKKK